VERIHVLPHTDFKFEVHSFGPVKRIPLISQKDN
jgi:hypothetical protein